MFYVVKHAISYHDGYKHISPFYFYGNEKHTQQLLYSTHQTLKPFVSHVVKLIEKVINSLYGQAFIQGISSCVLVQLY